jgi:nitroimidazol reductase NimA-like FMN-containing flavoprotein (pyridoxamine 5'-phosphate oxidase superfamily)
METTVTDLATPGLSTAGLSTPGLATPGLTMPGLTMPEVSGTDPGASDLIATSTTLTGTDCWELLATEQFGRVGLLVKGRPEILPVNYAIDGKTILFRTSEGSVLNEASMRVVAFEADRINVATHEGWSVMVQGVAQDIGNAIDPTSERLKRLALITWAPGTRQSWFRIDPDKVTGRRLHLSPDAL